MDIKNLAHRDSLELGYQKLYAEGLNREQIDYLYEEEKLVNVEDEKEANDACKNLKDQLSN